MHKDFSKLVTLIEDLGWDYDRMSSSGQPTYDKIVVTLNKLIDQMNRKAKGKAKI